MVLLAVLFRTNKIRFKIHFFYFDQKVEIQCYQLSIYIKYMTNFQVETRSNINSSIKCQDANTYKMSILLKNMHNVKKKIFKKKKKVSNFF